MFVRCIPFALCVLGILYLRWRWIQPKDVIGTCLEDTPYRASKMIRDVREQHQRESWCRSDPS